MSKVKRGASANYDTLSISDLKELPVQEVAADDAVLVLWCPASLLSEGIAVMEAWGFRQTQVHVWVKTKKAPLRNLKRQLLAIFKQVDAGKTAGATLGRLIQNILDQFDLGSSLAFGMGRLFRQTHELALVGVRGKVYAYLENKSQRSVHFSPATKHSTKPEVLQDMLDKMFPQARDEKLELFARRNRQGWTCIGLECPSTMGEDIRDSLDRLKS